MEIRQLFDPESTSLSYLVWDTDSHTAALIDPVPGQVERDIRLIRDLNLILKYTLHTHVHTDHIPSAGRFRDALNAIVVVHEKSQASCCADVLIKEGDFVPLGASKVHVLATPGHADSDVCYVIPGAVFSGDTLLIGDGGGPDLQPGDAGTLFDSITRHLYTLPDDTRIYPGHEYNGRFCSTIGEEKAHNPRISSSTSREAFIAAMGSLKLDPPQPIQEARPTLLATTP